ncbi:MAG: hypothetical protein DLM59_15570 [Pseudonocardiales bacterium]|nr:MAG: hypothetical protein DLM59_15570 [Pseudonocardiales bacterium]
MTQRDTETLACKLERLEGRATRVFFAGDHRPTREIRSGAKMVAYDMVNDASPAPERQLAALVDSVVCWLTHGDRYGSEETARLALETVVGPAVALAAVRVLTGDSTTT